MEPIDRASIMGLLTSSEGQAAIKAMTGAEAYDYFLYLLCSAPTIDPIRAVGGCRCGECRFASEDGAYQYPGQADTHVNCTLHLTSAHSVLIKPQNGFCDAGRPREAQDVG